VPERILVIEDEWQMRMLLHDNLQYEGYEVVSAGSGEEAMKEVVHRPPDLILLDLMLPGIDGFEVCRRLRAASVGVPIVIITVQKDERHRVTGLDLGADDFVTKPFSMVELLARIRAQLRRASRMTVPHDVFRLGDTVVDLTKRTVTRNGEPLDLSYREFELLRYLIAHPREDISREQLLHDVWGYSGACLSRTVDNFVAKLRHKLDVDPQQSTCILTVHGVGYRFVP
jgi:DNA-binding response OmpR family regulator